MKIPKGFKASLPHTWNRADVDSLTSCSALLEKGAHIRSVNENKRHKYEVVLPGPWTEYESASVSEVAFKYMLAEGTIRESDKPDRWVKA